MATATRDPKGRPRREAARASGASAQRAGKSAGWGDPGPGARDPEARRRRPAETAEAAETGGDGAHGLAARPPRAQENPDTQSATRARAPAAAGARARGAARAPRRGATFLRPLRRQRARGRKHAPFGGERSTPPPALAGAGRVCGPTTGRS